MLAAGDILLQKLDSFIRRYYKNQLIRGVSYTTIAVLITFLLAVVMEYYGHFGTTVRAVLFYSVLCTSIYFVVRFVLLPLAHMYRLGKIINHTQAAQIIGRHFPEVKDKLLNTLQLQHELKSSKDAGLLKAAIEQKTNQLKPIPFSAAIDIKKNVRYARYVLLPIMLYAALYLMAPGMISDGGKRVIGYSRSFKRMAPFRFTITNQNLRAEQFSDFSLEVKLDGSKLPDEVCLVMGDHKIKMQKQDNTHFSYLFNTLKRSEDFYFEANEFSSETYRLEVVSRPKIVGYKLQLQYPKYLNKKTETLISPGDITIPAGTVLNWQFAVQQANQVVLGFNGITAKAQQQETDIFTFRKKIFLSTAYYIKTANNTISAGDSLSYQISVLPDAHPTISAEEKSDTLIGKQIYFIGDAADDYGLSRLIFCYRFIKSDDKDKIKKGTTNKPIAVEKNATTHRFYYQMNLDEIGIAPSDEVEYYFEVWDNDGVHGPKSSKSKIMMRRTPSVKELEQKAEAGSSILKERMEEAIKESKLMQRELKDLERKMYEKRELTWEEKKET